MLFKEYSIGDFINQPSNPTEFEILLFDEIEEPEVDDYHKHTFYEILWTEKGKSKQTIDYEEYVVQPQCLFFISPNQVHHFEQWKGLVGGTILFTTDFFLLNQRNKDKLFELSFLDNFYSNPCLYLRDKSFKEIRECIYDLVAEHKRKDRSSDILRSLLHVLLLRIQRMVDLRQERALSKRSIFLFKEFRALLELHFASHATASYYAGKLHITSHHLNIICKEVAGRTATEIIRSRSVLEIKRFLTFSSLTIAEIADALNFSDGSYLARAFKAETGQSPVTFRTRMSEKYRPKYDPS